jgi:PAS domain S-box-containing protein/putative nucleotidyltransferase with HDIG domain
MNARSSALKISLVYVAAGAAWIGLSDLVAIALSPDPGVLGVIQMTKGWGFVVITGLLLYQVIDRTLRQLQQRNDEAAAAQRHLEALFNALPSGVQEVDTAGTITYVNPAYCRMTGRSAAELLGRPVWDMLPQQTQRDELQAYLGKLAAQQPEPTVYFGQTLRNDETVLQVQVNWDYRRDAHDKLLGFIAIITDVTLQRDTEQQIRQLTKFQQSIIESADIWINTLDADANVTLWNEAAERISGYGRDEVLGNAHIWERLYPDAGYRASVAAKAAAILQHGEQVTNFRTTIRCKDGSEKIISWNSRTLTNDSDQTIGSLAIGRDITGEVATEQALRESENRFRQLFAMNKAVELLIDPHDGHIIDANLAAQKFYGYNAEQFLQLHIYDINTLSQEEINKEMARARSERRDHFYFRHRLASGEIRDVEVHSGPIEIGVQTILYSIVHDITERRRAEAALAESERRFRHLFEHAPLAYQSLDSEGRLIEINQAWLDQFRIPRDEAIGQPFGKFLGPLSRVDFQKAYADFKNRGEAQDIIFEMLPQGGKPTLISFSGRAAYDGEGRFQQAHCILADINEREHNRRQLERTNRSLRTLSQCNEVLVHAGSEHELLHHITRLLIDTGGHTATWVGFGDQYHLELAAVAARETAAAQRLQQDFSGRLLECFLVGRTLELGQAQRAHSEFGTELCDCWEGVLSGDAPYALAMLPLKAGGTSLGVLCVFADEPAAFDDEQMGLLQELANDLAYGVHMQRTRAERDSMRGALSETLLQTVRALALTVEKRDPYTAGHQERVALLAGAIAAEMGMPPEQVEGIRLGGIIHDIGKIYIPAEILNRPGRLTVTEYAIIKSHPEVGHDIMKDVNFPWPVQEMILQHHERLDGSGYPRGLKDGEILLEARIIAVADVVEAISSHRPYRPSLGIDAAVEEMSRGRGTLYDPEVVDVCLKLIHEKHFRWEE